MSETEMEIVTALVRATKAVAEIADGALINVKTTVPIVGTDGVLRSIEIESWKCADCPETHLEARLVKTDVLRVVDPDSQEEA